jgi:hypothetical protein
MIDFTLRAIIPTDVVMREIAEESVILDLNTSTYYGLEGIGTRIWQVVTTSANLQQAFDTLLSEYDVNVETLADDFTKLLEELVAFGLLELA